MKPVTESPWVPLGMWKVGRLGAEGAMKERAEYQSPEETRRAHGRLPQEITDLTSRRLLSSCSPEAWWPFKDEPQPRRGEGARKDEWSQDWERRPQHHRRLPPEAHCPPCALCRHHVSHTPVGTGGPLMRRRSTEKPCSPSVPLAFPEFWSLKWLMFQLLKRILNYPYPHHLLNP